MAREARLTVAVGRLGILAIAVVGAHAARGAGADLSGFVGTWTFQGGSQVQATCSSLGTVSEGLSGARASVYPGSKTDLVFDMGCHCTIGLDVSGSSATLSGSQSCLVIPRGVELSGEISALTLDRASDGTLTLSFSGSNGVLSNRDGAGCALSSLSGSATLVRASTQIVSCGEDRTAVGVLPYAARTTIDCPFGAGVEDLRISMADEEQAPCSDATGSRGEGQWVLPDDPPRGPPICTGLHATSLTFCRVDGALFKSLTTALAPEQSYAVLKLGSVCPDGSVEIDKVIDNEDQPAAGGASTFLGQLGPNEVLNDPHLGTITRLAFCYFRGAASPDAVMPAFPDLGFPYAVFHAYADTQPPWVIVKRWIYSDDEDDQLGVDHYETSESDASILSDFQRVIENPQLNNTVFNLARVR